MELAELLTPGAIRVCNGVKSKKRLFQDLAEIAAAAHGIDEAAAIDGAGPDVAVTPEIVSQLLGELLRNVRHHAPDASARLSYDAGTFRLEDDGPGIPEKLYGQVFLPFRPVPYPDSAHRGMGLSIASRLCRIAGGSIALELPDEGGLHVCLSLPEHSAG